MSKPGLEASKRALREQVKGLSRRLSEEAESREAVERQLRDLALENGRLRRELAEAQSA